MDAALLLKSMLLEDAAGIFQKAGIHPEADLGYSEPVCKTIGYIQKHLSAQLSVRALTERLYLSEGTLAAYFKREIKTTVGQYIDEMIFWRPSVSRCSRIVRSGKSAKASAFVTLFIFHADSAAGAEKRRRATGGRGSATELYHPAGGGK